MKRYYYEDARWPWRPDPFLPRFLGQEKQIPRPARNDSWRGRALDVGMGYGRNALWLAEHGYAVEGWETDRRYVAEARREARRRRLPLHCRRVSFTRARFRGPYAVIVISNALHHVRRSAGLRVLRRARAALVRGGLLFLLVKLTRDRYFRRCQRDPAWAPVPGERNTLRRVRGPAERKFSRGRRQLRWLMSALDPGEVRAALRGVRLRYYREVVLRSDWGEPQPVTHHVAELVAERPKLKKRNWKIK